MGVFLNQHGWKLKGYAIPLAGDPDRDQGNRRWVFIEYGNGGPAFFRVVEPDQLLKQGGIERILFRVTEKMKHQVGAETGHLGGSRKGACHLDIQDGGACGNG